MRPRDHRQDWKTSPTAAAILHALACKGPLTIKRLAASALASESTTRQLVKQMQGHAVHIHHWISSLDAGGHPSMVIGIGKFRDARKPAAISKAENWNRWANRKRERYGNKLAMKMLLSRANGGADVIVIDGRKVYERRASA
jgi:hypothetical protein